MSSTGALFQLEDKVAIVTGGAKGIGMFYSEALANIGSNVVVADIDPVAVRKTTARLSEEHPGKVLGVELDVTKQATIEDMVLRIKEKWNRIDVLVNNAAIYANLPHHSSPWDIPDDEFDWVMAVNIRGVYACTRASLPLMEEHGWGRVINVASGVAFKGAPGLMHYAATKAAVVNLTRSMAAILGPKGINVNAIAPGNTESPTVLEVRAQRAAARGEAATTPARPRLGGLAGAPRIIDRTEVPEDLIGTLIFLATPASDFITGQTIVVDGGTYLH
jgi:NAD(P)-dependent dehydrogenase (short-subunit alcohol dehydrogenase family)